MEQIEFEYSLLSFLQTFQKTNLRIYKPQPNSISNVSNSLGLTYLTRLRVGLSHLREHKFHHNFRDSLNPTCNCGNAIESTKHYLLHCSNFKNQRQSQNVRIVNPNRLSISKNALNSVENIASAKRFNDPLIL